MADDLSKQLESLKIDRHGAAPREVTAASSRKWLGVLVGAVVLGAGAWAAADGVKERLLKPTVALGEISVISPAQADVKLMATGYVVPQRRAVVASKQPGRIEQLLVHEGDDVTRAQLIATLDDDDVRARLSEARAAVAMAEARVAAAQATLNQARRQVARNRQLHGKGALDDVSLEESDNRGALAEANLKAAAAEALTAVARADNAAVAVEGTRILAPFAGRVVRKLAEVGEVPFSSTGAVAGLVELVDLASLQVEADVSEGRIDGVKPGAPAEVSLDAFPGQRFRGEVVQTRPTVDWQKATVLVRVKFIDNVPGLLPQMAARVLFLGKALDAEALKAPSITVVPASAVLDPQGASAVFVVSEGRARRTSVQVGEAHGTSLELKQGPGPGTKVVLSPPASLRDGDAVKEKPAP